MNNSRIAVHSRQFAKCRVALAALAGVGSASASAFAATPSTGTATQPAPLAPTTASADASASATTNLGFATVPNELQANSPAPAGGGSAPPVGEVRVSTWSLMADTQLQSVQLSDLSTSFGLGIAYRSLRTDTSLIVRKGTEGSLADSALSAQFGHFALDPAAANVGASMRGMYFLNSGRYTCRKCADLRTFPGVQVGFRVSIDVGQTQIKATLADTTMESRSVAAGVLSLGVVARVSDDMVIDNVHRPIAIGAYLAGVTHVIGGDLAPQERKDIFGNDTELYFGVQGGLFFQIASAEVTMKVSQLWPSGDRVQGLTGFQLVPRVTFALPFDIVQYAPAAETKTPEPTAPPAAVTTGTAPATKPGAMQSESGTPASPSATNTGMATDVGALPVSPTAPKPTQ